MYCPDLTRAYIIRGRLESEGIAAEVVNQNTPVLSQCPALEKQGIRILVDEAEYDRAVRIIGSPLSRPVSCPFCSSRDTAVADASDVNPLFEAIRSIFRGFRQKYACRYCGRTFFRKV